jgi:hypothetical protein
VDITPVLISDPTRKIPFPSQDVTKNDTFRLPQDLSAFVANGSITQPILTDPNTLLRNRIGAQNITSTITIQIATNPPPPDGLFGGGTANVAFLLGDNQAQKPNADAVRMAATFWIETVTEQITVPPCNPGHPVTVQGDASAGNPVPSFIADPPHAVNRPFNVSVTYTQIQYSQLVILNFNGLSWPHASVATLVPNDPIAIPQNAFPAPGDGHGDGDGDGHGDHDGNHGHNGGRGRSG